MSRNAGETTIFLVRHARAGDREAWRGPDRVRPLSAAGLRQAERLPALLRAHGLEDVREVRSSPYLRCRQTVEPLGADLGLAVVDDDALGEGAPVSRLLERLSRSPGAVLCSHGDVIGGVVDHLERIGALGTQEPRIAKGSTWVLRLLGGAVIDAGYLPPPD